ncbi:DUF1992 domain-containing protein [Nocardioides zeae]|uniref:DUF1992 domain-containing protein n=1 Tax=Nocardioides imazamoxiresistens TaxID=3231893 RepID=A0ABU3Q2L8_9ACTN|nr:DUF1992 domain-containing protein [Nocardioides zeae]MDT9595302.1 DUF1992 domain-containing protein [Nocardioides zeae]
MHGSDDTPGTPDAPRDRERDGRTGGSAAAARIENQTQWVELQLQEARDRGDFDDLPGYGKPIRDLGSQHDPDWWVKRLVERENITGVLPPALALRTEDAELDARLDRLASPDEVRRAVTEFNDRVRRALYGNPGGPPLVTRQRDVDDEVHRWWERRESRRRLAAERARAERQEAERTQPTRRRWFRRTA